MKRLAISKKPKFWSGPDRIAELIICAGLINVGVSINRSYLMGQYNWMWFHIAAGVVISFFTLLKYHYMQKRIDLADDFANTMYALNQELVCMTVETLEHMRKCNKPTESCESELTEAVPSGIVNESPSEGNSTI